MYDYELLTEITLDASALLGKRVAGSQNKEKVDINVEGVLNFRNFGKLNTSEDSVYVGFQFSPVQVTISGKRAPDLEKLYQSFFIVAFRTLGNPLLFFYSGNLDEKDKLSLSELIKSVQVYIPPGESLKGRHHWHINEKHSAGEFTARYFFLSHACNTIYKENIRSVYIASPMLRKIKGGSDEGIKLTGHLVESGFKGIVDADVSWLKVFSGFEIFETHVKKSVLSRSRSRVAMNLRAFEPDPDLQIWKENRPIKEVLESFAISGKKGGGKTGTWEERRLQALRNKFEDVSLSRIMEDIRNSIDSGISRAEMSDLIHSLRDFLTIFQEEIPLIPNLIKELGLTENAAGSVILALELMGDPVAQDALIEIIEDDEQTSDNRLRGIVAAGGIEKPEKDLIDTLFDLSEKNRKRKNDHALERADTALLALGILSHNLSRGGNPSKAEDITNRIIDNLQATTDERERLFSLKALANTLSPEILPVLEPYFTSESPDERAASVRALRGFSDDQTLQLLTKMVDQEPIFRVRKAALETLMQRDGTEVVEYLNGYLPKEPDEFLRRMMIKFLGERKADYPVILNTLKNQLEHESSRELAKEIFRALYEE